MYYPLLFRKLMLSDTKVRERFIVKYKSVLDTIKDAKQSLDSENLSRVKTFYINIEKDGIRNAEKSISSLSDILAYEKYHKNSFAIIIFLISNDRIIKMRTCYGITSSEEHIIVKDLKKVTNTNSTIEFHYHGLHQPDCLEMNSYDEAVKLRILISELRENRKINK